MKATRILLISAITAIVMIGAAVAVVGTSRTGEDDQNFGLTSTKVTLVTGDTMSMQTWSLPDGAEYSEIQWQTSDDSIVSVSNGMITANGLGIATVTASLSSGGKEYSDSCTVTVASEKQTQMLSYDAYSENMDYAVLSGSGFEEGLLSLTFNRDGFMVISLPGYDPSWINLGGSGKYIGNTAVDFSKITMDLFRNGKTVASITYGEIKSAAGTDSITYNSEPYSPTISISGLDYGTYSVKYCLYYGNYSCKTVTGDFEYCEGDGLRDATGSFIRTYTWLCDGNGLAPGQKQVRSFSVEYSYSEYFGWYMKNGRSIKEYGNGVSNSVGIDKSPMFVTDDGNTSALASHLMADYSAAYGLSDYSTQHFAQYLLTFVQTQWNYEYDSTQYYRFDSEYADNCDYWAYSDETIFSGAGDCEDTTFLLCSLYRECGLDPAIILLPGHAMAAVSVDGFTDYSSFTKSAYMAKATKDGKNYYFCETTTNAPVIEKSTSKVTGISTKTYLTTSGSEKSNTLATTYAYQYALVGTISKGYVGTEFEFVTV